MASVAADAAAIVADQHGVLLTELAIVGGADFFSATIKSLVVILVTEIGDKTFFIAAVRNRLPSILGDITFSFFTSTNPGSRHEAW